VGVKRGWEGGGEGGGKAGRVEGRRGIVARDGEGVVER